MPKQYQGKGKYLSMDEVNQAIRDLLKPQEQQNFKTMVNKQTAQKALEETPGFMAPKGVTK